MNILTLVLHLGVPITNMVDYTFPKWPLSVPSVTAFQVQSFFVKC